MDQDKMTGMAVIVILLLGGVGFYLFAGRPSPSNTVSVPVKSSTPRRAAVTPDVPGDIRAIVDKAATGGTIQGISADMDAGQPVFVAEFTIGKLDHKLTLNSKGEVVNEEKDIAVTDLPLAAAEAIRKSYPEAVIDAVTQVRSGETPVYEVDIKSKNGDREVTVDGRGSITRDKRN